jgi:hypothetical protein
MFMGLWMLGALAAPMLGVGCETSPDQDVGHDSGGSGPGSTTGDDPSTAQSGSGGSGVGGSGSETRGSGECADEAVPPSGGPHDYYAWLASRPDCVRAYSLRNQAQIEEYRQSKTKPPSVTYDPANDTDPRKQDAAKVVIPETNVSLPTQVHLPIPKHTGDSLLVTWDAWWGSEFAYDNTGISNYKAFQLASPGNAIWTEVRARFSMAKEPQYVAMTDVRQYGLPFLIASGSNATQNPTINGRSYGSSSMGPLEAEFGVQPETWTRYWAFFEPQTDGQWYRFSLWVADETRDPVLMLDQVQLRPRIGAPPETSMEGSWDILRLEYNTSSSGVPEGRGPLVAYARNAIVLHGTALEEAIALLERPAN